MQEEYRISVPEQTATFTISSSAPISLIDSIAPLLQMREWGEDWYTAPLLQENKWGELYHEYSASQISNLYLREGKNDDILRHHRWTWPNLLICNTLARALELHALCVEGLKQLDGTAEISEPRSGFRERFNQHIQTEGRHHLLTAAVGGYGHVVLDIEPDTALDEVVFKSQVDKKTVPPEFIPDIAQALREAVFRGGSAGYPLIGFRATLINGSIHDVDSNFMGYQRATLIAMSEAFRHNDTYVSKV